MRVQGKLIGCAYSSSHRKDLIRPTNEGCTSPHSGRVLKQPLQSEDWCLNVAISPTRLQVTSPQAQNSLPLSLGKPGSLVSLQARDK